MEIVKPKKGLDIDLGSNIRTEHCIDNVDRFIMETDTGQGEMVMHNLFPGVNMLFNEFQMESCVSQFDSNIKMIGIDYCIDGRIEWEIPGGQYLYLQQGGLEIDAKRNHARFFSFPLSYYRGITLSVDIEEVGKGPDNIIELLGIDPDGIYRRFCGSQVPHIIDADKYVSRIFQEIYSVNIQGLYNDPEEFYRLKALDLLQYISKTDVSGYIKREYFNKVQVDKAKAIEKFMRDNVDRHFTIQELSSKFDIPATTLKLCFKGVYGTPIGKHMKKMRMNMASRMLSDTQDDISVIAGRLGYDNPSKFSAAFKSVKNCSPSEYRKTINKV